jgi:Transposase DDE domain
MHNRLVSALRQLGGDLDRYLESNAIEDVCRRLGYTWRKRVLDPVTTIHLFILQVLAGNTAMTHLRHLAHLPVSDSAYCQARARLPLIVFEKLLGKVVSFSKRITRSGAHLWCGRRLILADGSSFSMPDTPELQTHFGQSKKAKPGCGFPVARLMVVVHAATGLLLQAFAAPLHSHDMGLVGRVHPGLKRGDVMVADRGFASFAHMALLLARGVHAIFRSHQKQIVDFTPGRKHIPPAQKRAPRGMPRSRWLYALATFDQVVEYFKPQTRPEWMSAREYARLPESIRVREVRYRLSAPGFRTREVTLVTTLLDAEAYPAQELARAYGLRWQIEINLRHLKTTMGFEVLRCKTYEGVLKELTIFSLVYNLVRIVMMEAARNQGVEPDRISFIDALRWLTTARPGDPLPELVVLPKRPNRIFARAIKRRPKNYPWMSLPRAEFRKRVLEQQLADDAA